MIWHRCFNKLCGRPPQYAPPPVTLAFDFLTLKVVSESHVTWPTSMPILVFLGLFVLDLDPTYATDRQTSDVRQHHRLMPPPRGRDIINSRSIEMLHNVRFFRFADRYPVYTRQVSNVFASVYLSFWPIVRRISQKVANEFWRHFLEGWDVRSVTAGQISVMIRIAMQI